MWKPWKNISSAGRFLAVGGVVTTFTILIGGPGLAQAVANPPAVSGKALTKDTTPTWNWVSGGSGNGQFRYKLDNSNLSIGAAETGLTAFTPASPLAEGKHILYVQEKDGTGAWSASGKRAVTIDITPPTPPAVVGKTPSRDTTPAWNWTTGGGGGNGTFRYKLDNAKMAIGATIGTSTAYTPPAPLTEGQHILYIQERDAAGNWSALAKKAIVVDRTPPVAPVVDGATPTYDTTPTWTWMAAGGGSGTFRYKLDDDKLATGATFTTLTTFTPDAALSLGSHVLYVQERDWAGNWSPGGGHGILIEEAPVVTSSLPDTGQTKCYNNSAEISCPTPGQAFHGQDASYTINPPSYTVHDNGTVTDNVTGLMWQREDDNTTRTWADAIVYCEALSLAGYTDWRLPAKKELVGIVDYNKPWPGPTIDQTAFPNTISSYYWSSTAYAHDADAWYVNFSNGGAWIVIFDDGSVDGYGKNLSKYARCVRGGQ